jgi:hypothetical protein
MRFRRLLLAVAYAVVLAAGYALVFVAPWHAAPGSPSNSDSYAVGFSNRVSLLGVLFTAAALFGLGFVARKRDGRPLVRSERPEKGEGVPWWLVALLLAVSVASAVFFVWISYRWWWYGEKNYFLDRLAYMVNGNVPYHDMEFTYGPLLAYLPSLAWRLLRPFGVPAQAAYGAVYVALFATGVPLLAYATNRLELTRGQRAALFAGVGACVAINETVGINGLLIRFLLPVAAVLFFHGRATEALARSGRDAALRLWLWAALAAVACFAVSPEVGIACFIAVGVYLAWLAVVMKRREAVWAILGLALTPLLAVASLGTALFTHLLGMASGALNFPVVPSPDVLVFLFALLGASALLPRFLCPDQPATPAMLGLGVIAAVMLAGALGRADTSHVYFYGVAAAFFAAPVLAAVWRPAFFTWILAFAVVFVAAHWMTVRYDYSGAIVDAAAGTPGVSRLEAGRLARLVGLPRQNGYQAWDQSRGPAAAIDVEAFRPYQPIAAPLGFTDETGMRLAERGWLASPYFRGVPFTPEQLTIEREYLGRARHVMVLKSYWDTIGAQPDASAKQAPPVYGTKYFDLLMWPQSFPMRNEPPDLAGELKAYIAGNYRFVTTVGSYAVLERKE